MQHKKNTKKKYIFAVEISTMDIDINKELFRNYMNRSR